MAHRLFIRLTLLGIGVALGARINPAAAWRAVQTTPTPDRLAAPPTLENPTQADDGAQLYWRHCQPCHGDVGQGLTDEWRAQYPPEDQNCWDSGCHGERPYENGFQLPARVPAVVGSDALARFGTAADLRTFISATMPFQAPGSLSASEYWALTAFLLRARGLPESDFPLDDEAQARRIVLNLFTPTPSPTPPSPAPTQISIEWLGLGAGGLLLFGVVWFVLRRRRSR